MIAYFIDNYFKQKSTVSTGSETARITDDQTVQNVKGGATIELEIAYKGNVDKIGKEGDFLFAPSTDRRDASFFQIISREVDYIKKVARFYGDTNLLWFASQNETTGTYGRLSEIGQPIAWYLEEFTSNVHFPFEIGVNEIGDKLATGDTNASTAKEALDKTAQLFGVEIAFSFVFNGKTVKPYIDIYEEFNGDETGETLVVGEDITGFVETSDCSDIATAVRIRGVLKSSKNFESTSEMTNDPDLAIGDACITNGIPWKVHEMKLATNFNEMTDPEIVYKRTSGGVGYYVGDRSGTGQKAAIGWETKNGFAINLADTYGATIDKDNQILTYLPEYDVGDYYTNKDKLFSRSAWYRFGSPESGRRETAKFGADIILQAEDVETDNPQQILSTALALLEQHKQPTISYSCDCVRRVDLGAYYTLKVPDEKIYISARCLEVAKSETRNKYTSTFGNYYKYANAFEIMARNAT